MRNFLPVFKHFVILLWCLQFYQCQNLNEEKTKKSKDKSLREYLLEGYDKYERPYNSFKNGTRNGEKFSISYTKARVFPILKWDGFNKNLENTKKSIFQFIWCGWQSWIVLHQTSRAISMSFLNGMIFVWNFRTKILELVCILIIFKILFQF